MKKTNESLYESDSDLQQYSELNKIKTSFGYSIDSVIIIKADNTLEKQIYHFNDSDSTFYQLYQFWDGSDWKNDWKHLYAYNSKGDIIARWGEYWIDSTWLSSWLFTYDYDENDNRIAETYQQNPNYGELRNYKRSLNTFNDKNQAIQRLDQIWNGSEWIDKWRAEYNYDEFGNRSYLISQDYISGVWQNNSKFLSEYNSKNQLLKNEHFDGYGTNDWLNDSKTLYFYNEKDSLVLLLSYDWEANNWTLVDSTTYEYDQNDNLLNEFNYYNGHALWFNNIYNEKGNKTEQIIWYSTDSLWILNTRYTYEYNLDNKLILELIESYYDNKVLYTSKIEYEYTNDLLTEIQFERTDSVVWSPYNAYYTLKDPRGRIYYLNGSNIKISYSTFTEITDSKSSPTNFQLNQNYPNPFNPTTNIEFNIPDNEYVTLNVYNSIGQKINTLVDGVISSGHHTIEFNGENLSSGIYFYQLSTNRYYAVKKMMLLK